MMMASKPLNSLASRGLRKRSRVSVVTGLIPLVCRAAVSNAPVRALSPSTACTRARRLTGKAKVPQPAKRSATRFAGPMASNTASVRAAWAVRRGLKERAGRWDNLDPVETLYRRTAFDNQVALMRQAGQVVALCKCGKHAKVRAAQITPARDIDIKPRFRQRQRNPHLALACSQQTRQRLADIAGCPQLWPEHVAIGAVDHRVRRAPVKPDNCAGLLPPTCQNGAAPAVGWGGRHRRHTQPPNPAPAAHRAPPASANRTQRRRWHASAGTHRRFCNARTAPAPGQARGSRSEALRYAHPRPRRRSPRPARCGAQRWDPLQCHRPAIPNG